ncbi:MAG: hypothetical protein ACYCYE_14865 [Clostridia bacterium]
MKRCFIEWTSKWMAVLKKALNFQLTLDDVHDKIYFVPQTGQEKQTGNERLKLPRKTSKNLVDNGLAVW